MTLRCIVCGKFVALRVDPEVAERHAAAAFVLNAFTNREGVPYLSPDERELFISACCNACWEILCVDPNAHPTAYN